MADIRMNATEMPPASTNTRDPVARSSALLEAVGFNLVPARRADCPHVGSVSRVAPWPHADRRGDRGSKPCRPSLWHAPWLAAGDGAIDPRLDGRAAAAGDHPLGTPCQRRHERRKVA
jgi:hypothetical protein